MQTGDFVIFSDKQMKTWNEEVEVQKRESPLYDGLQMIYALLGGVGDWMEQGDDAAAALRLLDVAENCMSEAREYFESQK